MYYIGKEDLRIDFLSEDDEEEQAEDETEDIPVQEKNLQRSS